jgi:hypothetical protein
MDEAVEEHGLDPKSFGQRFPDPPQQGFFIRSNRSLGKLAQHFAELQTALQSLTPRDHFID